jgi:UDP-glucose 4-epimerase
VKALVTGGAGFLGSHLARALLDRGDDVVVFDHRLRGKGLDDDVLRRLTAIEDDIFNFDAVRHAAQGCSVIFHCAAMVGMEAYSKQPAKTMDTEEVGLRHVCRAALEGRDVRVVYASSSAVYGTAGGAVGLREDLPVAPVSNYGVAKRFNEVYLASEFAEHGLSSAAMRIFNMYGPGQDDRLVIPRFIRSALTGNDLVIYGDGAQTRDFIYVDDVVNAMLASVAQANGHQTINVCSGQEVAVRDLAAMIIRLAASRSQIAFREPPAERVVFEQSRCFGSREKMQALRGIRTAIPLKDGLRRTIASIVSPS